MVDKLDVTIRNDDGKVVFAAKGQDLESYSIERPAVESPTEKGFKRYEPSATTKYTFEVKHGH